MDIFKFNEIFDDDTHNVTKIPKNEYKKSGIIPIIDQGKEFIAGYSDCCKSKKIENTRIIFGDHTRIIKFIDFEAYIGADGVKVLKIKNKNADYKYMYYYLKNSYIPDTGYNRHYKWLKELKFTLPLIEEQKVISTKLDKVQEIIDIRKGQLGDLDKLIKSQFVEMFENEKYPKKRMDEVATLKSGTTFDKEYELQNGDLLYCKVSDMNLEGNEKYMLSSKTYVSKEVGLKASIPANSVIFPKRGGAIGTNKKRILLNDTCVDLNTMGVTPKENINIQYLYYYFINIDLATLCDGSAIPQLNNKNIGPLEIAVPPLEKQNQFAEFVKLIDKQKVELQKSLEEMEKLQESLMNKYFG